MGFERSRAQLRDRRVEPSVGRQGQGLRATIQARLVVGAARDPCEAEADRIAAAVVNGLRGPPALMRSAVGASRIRLNPAAEGSRSGVDAVDDEIGSRIHPAGSGAPSDGADFGSNLSSVQLHTGPTVDGPTRRLDTVTFAAGRNIFLRHGAYTPQPRAGPKIVDHELAHVVQQSGVQRCPDGVIQRFADEDPGPEWSDTDAILAADRHINAEFLKNLYPTYYRTNKKVRGQRRSDYAKKLDRVGSGGTTTVGGRLYSKLGKAPKADYLNQPIDLTTFNRWVASNAKYWIDSQERYDIPSEPNAREQHKPKQSKHAKETGESALKAGDYFHVYNKSADTTAKKGAALKGAARRVIVNVATQNDAFQTAQALTKLFEPTGDADDISPWIREFKVYLSNNPTTSEIKKDKIVVYYRIPGGAQPGPDTVGDRIVEAVWNAVPKSSLISEFAPFYAQVGPGIAWAEEAKYHSNLRGSFTQSRTALIAAVIHENATVATPAEFIRLVDDKFRANNVDPDRPAQHTSADTASATTPPALTKLSPEAK
jgi:hypothetical protein